MSSIILPYADRAEHWVMLSDHCLSNEQLDLIVQQLLLVFTSSYVHASRRPLVDGLP